LEVLICKGNQLTSLDISNNHEFGSGWNCNLDIRDMPSLTKVCVWVIPFPPEGLNLCSDGSPNVYFTTDCSK